MTYSAWGNTS